MIVYTNIEWKADNVSHNFRIQQNLLKSNQQATKHKESWHPVVGVIKGAKKHILYLIFTSFWQVSAEKVRF